MKKIVITGGTGLIGSYIIPKMIEEGYNIVVLSRTFYGVKNNVTYILWDHKSIEPLEEILSDAYGIINLAGASVSEKRWTETYKELILNSRILPTKAISEAILNFNLHPDFFISASGVGYYGTSEEKIYSENDEVGNDYLADVCQKWEEESQKASMNTRVINTRFGVVLSTKGGALGKLLPVYKMYLGGKLGSGKQWLPWVGINQVYDMILFIIENKTVSGAVNLVANNCVNMETFSAQIAKTLHRPNIFWIPSFILKLLMGKSSIIVLKGQKVEPRVLIEAGYKGFNGELKEVLNKLINKGI